MHRASGARGHQLLEIRSALIGNGINGLIRKLIALDNIALQITLLAQLEYFSLNRGDAYFRPAGKMVVLHILLNVIGALRFFQYNTKYD